MKAAKFFGPGDIRVTETERPVLRDADQVLIKVRRVGICGSDVHIYHGTNPFARFPVVFGHEFVGDVEEKGEGVTGLCVGDRVICEPIEYCGSCYACRSGSPNVCEGLKVLGVHTDGGAAEYVALNKSKVFRIDGDIPLDEAALAEPLTIGAQVCLRGGIRPGDVVFIMGCGAIGLCILMMAKREGAVCIISDVVPEKLDFARSVGADYTINALTEDTAFRLLDITGGMGPNVVADTVCTAQSLELAASVVSVAGRVVELGFGEMKAAIPLLTLTKKQVSLIGSRLQTHRFPIVAEALNSRTLPLKGFADVSFPFEEAAQAFRYADKSMGKYRKILLTL